MEKVATSRLEELLRKALEFDAEMEETEKELEEMKKVADDLERRLEKLSYLKGI